MKIHLARDYEYTKCGKKHTLIRRDGTIKRSLPLAEKIDEADCKMCPKD